MLLEISPWAPFQIGSPYGTTHFETHPTRTWQGMTASSAWRTSLPAPSHPSRTGGGLGSGALGVVTGAKWRGSSCFDGIPKQVLGASKLGG